MLTCPFSLYIGGIIILFVVNVDMSPEVDLRLRVNKVISTISKS